VAPDTASSMRTSKTNAVLKLVVAAERVVISTLMASIVLLTLAQVLFRYVLNSPLGWSEELARYAFVWVTFLGASVLLRRRDGHPAVDSLHQSVGPRAKQAIEVFGRFAVIVASLAVSVGGLRLLALQWRQLSPSIELPMAGVYSCMFLCPLWGVFWVLWLARHGPVEDGT
jgi:TRAP-type C4-dicarboxylate transport system permease small subunit